MDGYMKVYSLFIRVRAMQINNLPGTGGFTTLRLTVFFSILVTASFTSWAGGIALGVTRVVYPANAKQVSVPISNSDKKSRFLIQSWVDDESGKKSSSFIITPPLFVSKADSETTLRLMYTGAERVTDREQVYWLNSKAIPAVNREEIKDKNVLQIAILSRIKIFFRPLNLPYPASEAVSKMSFSRKGSMLNINNASPYYITLVNLSIDGRKLPNTMVAPQSVGGVSIKESDDGNVRYQTINDYGANTPMTTVQVK